MARTCRKDQQRNSFGRRGRALNIGAEGSGHRPQVHRHERRRVLDQRLAAHLRRTLALVYPRSRPQGGRPQEITSIIVPSRHFLAHMPHKEWEGSCTLQFVSPCSVLHHRESSPHAQAVSVMFATELLGTASKLLHFVAASACPNAHSAKLLAPAVRQKHRLVGMTGVQLQPNNPAAGLQHACE